MYSQSVIKMVIVISACFFLLVLTFPDPVAALDVFALSPQFITEPSSQFASIGDVITLPCEARLSSDASSIAVDYSYSVQWFKNGVEVPVQVRTLENSLDLRIKSDSDFGKYQCLVKFFNVGSLLSRVAFIKPTPWPSLRAQDNNLTQINVLPGNVAVITCGSSLRSAFGPLPGGYEIQYYFENVALSSDDPHFVTSNGNLLMVMKSSRVGIYQCRVVGPSPSRTLVYQRSFDLRLQPSDQRSPVRPMFFSPDNVTVRQEDNVTLECVYRGSPVPSNRWEMYDRFEMRPKIIGETDRRLRFGSLHLVNVSTLDEGRYVCLGDNTGKGAHNAPASRVINLRVLPRVEPPRITVSVESSGLEIDVDAGIAAIIDVTQSDRVTLACATNANDVVWLLNGNSTIIGSARAARNLTINRFDRAVHEGLYQCFVENDANFETFHTSALLRVVYAPTTTTTTTIRKTTAAYNARSGVATSSSQLIVEKPQNCTVKQGHVAVFTCAVRSASSVQVTWLRENQPIGGCDAENGAGRVCVLLLDGSKLVLYVYSAQPSDAGLYTCAVELPNRFDTASVWLNVVHTRQNSITAAPAANANINLNRITNNAAGRNTNQVTQPASIQFIPTQLSKAERPSASSLHSTPPNAVESKQAIAHDDFSGRQSELDNALKSFAENPVYLTTLIACCIALLGCALIAVIAVLRRKRRRSKKMNTSVASSSFSKHIDLAPVGIVYNKLSQCDSTPLSVGYPLSAASSAVAMATAKPAWLGVAQAQAQVNPYASTPIRPQPQPALVNVDNEDNMAHRFTLSYNGSYLTPAADNYSYASIAQRSTRPCSYAPEVQSSVETDSCSDEDLAAAASPRKRVKYNFEPASDLDPEYMTTNEANLQNAFLNNTLNRSKLTAVRKFSAASDRRSPSVMYSPSKSSNTRNNTFRNRTDKCEHEAAVSDMIVHSRTQAYLPPDFHG